MGFLENLCQQLRLWLNQTSPHTCHSMGTAASALSNDNKKASDLLACPCGLTTLGRQAHNHQDVEQLNVTHLQTRAGNLVTGARPSHSGKPAHCHVTHGSHSAPEHAACHSRQHHSCPPTQKQCLTAGRPLPCSPTTPAGCPHLLCYSELAIFLALQHAGIRVAGRLLLGGSVCAAQVVAGEASMLCRQAAWSPRPCINHVPISKMAAACHTCKGAPLRR